MRKLLQGIADAASPIIIDSSDLNSFIHERKIRSEDVIGLNEKQKLSLIKLESQVEFSGELQDQLNNGFYEEYGKWIYYPRLSKLIQIIEKEDFIKVRTLRNKYKISEEEQSLLAQKEISIIGLSAGNSVAIACATERICGKINLFDFDDFDLSNLNRITGGIGALGWNKAVYTANQILEIDPYIEITLNVYGYKDLDEDLEVLRRSDVIIDECDSFEIKIKLRERCKEFRKPIFMHTSERGIIDIELFDMEPSRPIFHGLLENVDLSNYKEVLLNLINPEIVSDSMRYSFSEIGKTISSWPQLASEVIAGGANITTATRYYLLGQNLKSGRYFVNCEELLC